MSTKSIREFPFRIVLGCDGEQQEGKAQLRSHPHCQNPRRGPRVATLALTRFL